MEAWDRSLFELLNASATAGPSIVAFARLAASWPPYLVLVIIAALWVWGSFEKRSALLTAAMSLAVGMATNAIVHSIWHHPRPEELGAGHTLIPHAQDTSFPSDHVTFIWSLGLGLIVTKGWRLWAVVAGGLGLLTAWARIYLGVHFPIDIVGSAAVSVFAATVGFLLRPAIIRSLQGPIEWIYQAALDVLHVPTALFPRRELQATFKRRARTRTCLPNDRSSSQ